MDNGRCTRVNKWLILTLLLMLVSQRGAISQESHMNGKGVVLGVENLLQNHLDLIKGKRVGLMTNPSGVDRNLRSTVDLLFKHPDINLTALFGRERN